MHLRCHPRPSGDRHHPGCGRPSGVRRPKRPQQGLLPRRQHGRRRPVRLARPTGRLRRGVLAGRRVRWDHHRHRPADSGGPHRRRRRAGGGPYRSPADGRQVRGPAALPAAAGPGGGGHAVLAGRCGDPAALRTGRGRHRRQPVQHRGQHRRRRPGRDDPSRPGGDADRASPRLLAGHPDRVQCPAGSRTGGRGSHNQLGHHPGAVARRRRRRHALGGGARPGGPPARRHRPHQFRAGCDHGRPGAGRGAEPRARRGGGPILGIFNGFPAARHAGDGIAGHLAQVWLAAARRREADPVPSLPASRLR